MSVIRMMPWMEISPQWTTEQILAMAISRLPESTLRLSLADLCHAPATGRIELAYDQEEHRVLVTWVPGTALLDIRKEQLN